MAKRGEVPDSLGHYATGLESSLIAFCVGGTFVSFHYNEMLWHFFGVDRCTRARRRDRSGGGSGAEEATGATCGHGAPD